MKRICFWPALAIGALLLAGCSSPSPFEKHFFSIQTNTVPLVVASDTGLPAPMPRTPPGPEADLGLIDPAAVPAPSLRSPGAAAAPFVEDVSFTPNENARAVADTSARVAGLFGPFGEMAGALVAAAFGFWGWFRSSRNLRTAETLAQSIETGRKLLVETPDGSALDAKWVAWMVKQQAAKDVLADVARIVRDTVDPATAQMTAEKLFVGTKPAAA